MICSLCHKESTVLFLKDEKRKRAYFKCSYCDLIFLNPDDCLSHEEELSRYKQHENSELTDGYKNFLYNIINPVKKFINPTFKGLDFGCGPHPMLIELLKKEGFSNIFGFDPYFFNNQELLKDKFDFITCCEVVEHFNSPHEVFRQLSNLLKREGYLFIQTGVVDKQINFSSWSYRSDLTHVSFYSKDSFNYICNKFYFELISIENNIVILKKN